MTIQLPTVILRAQVHRNRKALRSGRCHGVSAHRNVRPTYAWLTRLGRVIPLCPACLAAWSRNAEDDPELAPRLVVSLGV